MGDDGDDGDDGNNKRRIAVFPPFLNLPLKKSRKREDGPSSHSLR